MEERKEQSNCLRRERLVEVMTGTWPLVRRRRGRGGEVCITVSKLLEEGFT